MLGGHLAALLRARGDEVWIVTRNAPSQEHELQWDRQKGIHDVKKLEGLDVLFNLTGAPIADRPWTTKRRETLRDSRIASTEALYESLAKLDAPPRAYIGAGQLGIFGNRDDDVVGDDEPRAETGFLAELSSDWEDTHLAATERIGARAAVLRMSIVLSHTGGVFPLMVMPFRVGIGGWLGHGRQYTSWVSDRDAAAAFVFVADHDELDGAFNCTVPEPVQNKEWFKALGRALSRPVMTHAPRWALRGALGEFANDLLIASLRAVPQRLLAAGFTFQDTDAEQTFRRLVTASQEPQNP